MMNDRLPIDKPIHQVLGKCPVCRALLQGSNTVVIERRQKNTLFHVDCSRCRSSVLMIVIDGPLHMVTTVGMLTDISKSDIERMRLRRCVNPDDVLTMHAFLEQEQRG